MFVDADHRHEKVTGILTTELFSVVVSTPKTWSSKHQTAVKISKFGAKFTALKKAVEGSVIIRYHLISMGVKVSKYKPIFVDNMSAEL